VSRAARIGLWLSVALAGAGAGAGAAGCSAGLAHPTVEDADWAAAHRPGTTLADLQAGRDLYVHHCAGCHDLHRPEEFPPERWPAIVAEMAAEAKLAPLDRDRVVTFLRAASARLRSGPAVAPAAPATAAASSGGKMAGAP
jgi:hypothetical protein